MNSTIQFKCVSVYPNISQTNTAIKWLVLYHSYPLLSVPTFTSIFVGCIWAFQSSVAIRPWLNFLRDAIACSAHVEAAAHWNLQLWSPKQQNKKENQENLPHIKIVNHVPAFVKKTRKSSPLLPTARFVAKLGSCFRISRKTLKDRDAGDPSNAC